MEELVIKTPQFGAGDAHAEVTMKRLSEIHTAPP